VLHYTTQRPLKSRHDNGKARDYAHRLND